MITLKFLYFYVSGIVRTVYILLCLTVFTQNDVLKCIYVAVSLIVSPFLLCKCLILFYFLSYILLIMLLELSQFPPFVPPT